MAAKARCATCNRADTGTHREYRARNYPVLLALALALLTGCSAQFAPTPEALFAEARANHKQGHFAKARELASIGFARFQKQPQSEWHWKFKLLSAEMDLWNGETEKADLLLSQPPPAIFPKLLPRYQMLRAYVLFRKQNIRAARELLARAEEGSRRLR